MAQQLQQPNNLPIFSTSRNRYPMNLMVPDWHFLTVQLIVEDCSDASGSFVKVYYLVHIGMLFFSFLDRHGSCLIGARVHMRIFDNLNVSN